MLLCTLMVLAAASANAANDWGNFAVISSTLGVTGNRMCIGEGLRVSDIGCPGYAPTVLPSGNLGLSNTNPIAKLDVWGSVSASDAIQVGQSNFTCINAISGSIRYNTTSDTIQVCTGSGWKSLVSGTAGAGTVTGTGSATAVAYWSGASGLTYDSSATNGFYYDNINHRLGIGTNAPSAALEVSASSSSFGNPVLALDASSTQTNLSFRNKGALKSIFRADLNGSLVMSPYGISAGLYFGYDNTIGTTNHYFYVSGTTTRMAMINTTGMAVGDNAGPAYTLDVSGSFRVSNTGADPTLFANNGKVGIGTIAPAATLQVSGTFIVSNSTQSTTPSIYVASSGFVGVGTTAPHRPLEISSSVGNGGRIRITGTATNGGAYSGIEFYGGAAGTAWGGGLFREQSTNDIAFYTASDANTAKMTLSSAGNLGISNTNPVAKLDVWGTVSASDAIQVGQSNLTCINAISGSIRYNTTSDTLQVCTGSGWKSLVSGTAGPGTLTGTGSATAVAFWNGASGLTYDDGFYYDQTNGRLGIGTNTPSGGLEISTSTNTATNPGLLLNSAANQNYIAFRYKGATTGTIRTDYNGAMVLSPVSNNAAPVSMYFGYDSFGPVTHAFFVSGSTTRMATINSTGFGIGANMNAPAAILDVSGSMRVSTTTQTANNPSLYVTSGGSVGIGTNAPAYALDVSGYAASTGFVQTSDRRLKTDIVQINSGLAIIDRLKPVTFRWKKDGRPAVGLIAQDVLPIIPTAVTSNTAGIYSVEYAQTIPYLIKGMQELNANVVSLTEANDNLMGQLKAANDNHLLDEELLLNLAREVERLMKVVGAGR